MRITCEHVNFGPDKVSVHFENKTYTATVDELFSEGEDSEVGYFDPYSVWSEPYEENGEYFIDVRDFTNCGQADEYGCGCVDRSFSFGDIYNRMRKLKGFSDDR